MTLQDMSKQAEEFSSDWRVQHKMLLALVGAYTAGLYDAREQAILEADDCDSEGEKSRCMKIATACLHMAKSIEP